MADKNPELDLGQGKSKGSMSVKNLMMIIIAGVVLVGVSVGLSLYITSGSTSADAGGVADTDLEEAVEEVVDVKLKPAIYESLDPQFVVNFAHNGILRYLQVSISVMTRDDKVVEQVRHHLPAIRHEIIALLSSRNYEQLGSIEGKDEIRELMKDEIQQIIRTNDKEPGIEEVFLTGFVMQ